MGVALANGFWVENSVDGWKVEGRLGHVAVLVGDRETGGVSELSLFGQAESPFPTQLCSNCPCIKVADRGIEARGREHGSGLEVGLGDRFGKH